MATKRKTRDAEHTEIRAITEQLAELASMTSAQLAVRHIEVMGVPTRSRNVVWLRKRLAWRLQQQAEGGLSKEAVARIDELAPSTPARWNRPAGAVSDRDPRLPHPGTMLSRAYKGATHEVTVLAEGFEYAGRRYGSLSTIAEQITGTVWNGLVFFGLKRRTKKRASA